jgi:transposase
MNQNRNRDLSDKQWDILDILIPEPTARRDGRGRPWQPRRSVLNGILWVLRTGAPWSALPERYFSYQTCLNDYGDLHSIRPRVPTTGSGQAGSTVNNEQCGQLKNCKQTQAGANTE